jgi:rare lipoprotein A
MLLASLRTDGRPATLNGPTTPPTTMIAQSSPSRAAPVAQVAPAPQTVATITQPLEQPSGTTIVPATVPLPPPRATFAAPVNTPPSAQIAAVTASLPAFAPLPPPRPLDLSTIPGADTPISATRRRAPAPIFYAEPSAVTSTLIQRRPFDGVSLEGLTPLH